MRQSRRVAQFARKVEARQGQVASVSLLSASGDRGNPHKPSLRQPRQPIQPDSDTPYMRNTIQHESRQDTPPDDATKNDVSHVRTQNQADEADQADGTRESAALNGGAEADGSLTEADGPWAADPAERQNWAPGDSSDTWAPWTSRPDVITVVEDLSDEGQRPGKIGRLLGLRRGEVIAILRRTGR